MSVDDFDPPSPLDPGSHPLDDLPRFTRRQVALARRLRGLPTAPAVAWLEHASAAKFELGAPEILSRASGLRRTGITAQFVWPRLATRVGLGLDTALAHALVDRLLGYDRGPGDGRLPVSPVELGILTYACAESLRRLAEAPGVFGPWDLTLDRVGHDPFDFEGLGPVVTLRWPVRFGAAEGSVRLWAPETLLARWLSLPPPATEPAATSAPDLRRWGNLAGVWRAEAGLVRLPRGMKALRAGGVLPVTDTSLGWAGKDPEGSLSLTLRTTEPPGRLTLPGRLATETGGGRFVVTAGPRPAAEPPEDPAMSLSPETAVTDLPVTLVVEIGRAHLTLSRLADLKPGDVIDLNRHSREPVELTSGGRTVARGELVQIDTELGVRVTHVLL